MAVVGVVGVVLLQLRVDLGVGQDVAARDAVLVRALPVAVTVPVRVPAERRSGRSVKWCVMVIVTHFGCDT